MEFIPTAPLDKPLTFIGGEYKLTEIAMHSVKENHFSCWPESKLKISGSVSKQTFK
jgi:hypothetical protein